MSLSAIPKTLRDTVISIADGTGTPITMTVSYAKGDFALSNLNQGNSTITAYKSRGVIYGLRKDEDQPPTFSFSADATDISDATVKCLQDWALKQGAFASGVSTYGANADVWTTTITLTIAGTSLGDSADHTFVLTKCFVETCDWNEGNPNIFQVKGTVYGTCTRT